MRNFFRVPRGTWIWCAVLVVVWAGNLWSYTQTHRGMSLFWVLSYPALIVFIFGVGKATQRNKDQIADWKRRYG